MSQTSDPKAHLLPAERIQRHRRRRNITLISSIVCVVITGVLLVITLAITLSVSPNGLSDNGEQSNCITPDVCNSNILEYIDTTYDPCDDFFNYSCGGWLSANPLNGRNQIDIADELNTDKNKYISDYLTKPVQSSDPDAIKKAKYIFSACTNVAFIQENYIQHLQAFIKNAGGWADIGILPDGGWEINNDLANNHYLGSSAFFTILIVPDDHNSSKPVIKVTQGGLSLSSPQKYYNTTGNDFQVLLRNIKVLLDTVKLGGSTGNTSAMAIDIANYEQSLALESLTSAELRNLSAVYNPMTLQQLSTIFNLDWVQFLNSFSNNSGFTLNFTNSTVVNVATPEYFQNISKIAFNATNQNTIANYARWQLLYSEYKNYAAFLNDGIKEFFNTELPLAETASLGCAQVVEKLMPMAVARPFVEEFITKEAIDQVNKSVNQILKAFTERITENNWLDSYSKNQCKDKVNAISRRIAYPDFIKSDSKLDNYYEKLIITSSATYFDVIANVTKFTYYQYLSQYMVQVVDRTVWLDFPTSVNAYYYAPFNQINILAGILRVPFFATNWPPFLLYGALGTVVSHEITHGFDNNGRQYDKNGNRTRWWSSKAIDQFNQHAQCFVDQYGNYTIQGYRVDGELTLGENIADNGGVHTAFRAYKNVMNQTGEEQTIGGHTLDQLFFVAFSQLWCGVYSDAAMSELITDVHSPSPVRVFGTLANSEEFAAAFKCRNGSKMNPLNKCQLW